MLNDDGTVETDGNGHEIRTYTNQHISEYAKVFVGLNKQSTRGNIEDATGLENAIDPLNIVAENKDHFPKVRRIRSIFSGFLQHAHFTHKIIICISKAWYEQ